MANTTEYAFVWLLYVLSALTLQLVLWRMTRSLKVADVRMILQLIAAALLFTPSKVDPELGYWAPAFMSSLMEFMAKNNKAAVAELWLVMMSSLVLLIVYAVYRRISPERPAINAP